MPQPDLILTPFAQDAPPSAVDNIPEVRSPSDPTEKATWTQGFPGLTMIPLAAGGIPPRGQDVNGVLRAISEHVAFQGGGGQYKWSAEYVAAKGGYEKGAVIQSDDGLSSYVSAVDGNAINPNTTPGSIGNQWLASGGAAKANASTTITAGLGLTGGGDLSGNLTISADFGTTAGTIMQGNDSRITGAAQKSANLSDLASASDARQNLGLGTAATRDVQTSPTDTTAGALMEVGAFGLGAVQSVYGGDLNDLKRTQMTGVVSVVNGPGDPGTIGVVTVVAYSSDWVIQNYYESLSDRQWVRSFHNGTTWTSWKELFNTGNILPATGQSAELPMTQKAVTDELNTKVSLTGNQTISGVKTFSSFPVTPSAAPTANYQAANKKYVDDSAIGVGQTWQDVVGSRSKDTTYTNTTGRPIQVSISIRTATSGASSYSFLINGVTVASDSTSAHISDNTYCHVIPANDTYRIEVSANTILANWAELR